MSKDYFIPEHVEVALQKRLCPTGKLGFTTYKDRKGRLRNSKSWSTWGDQPSITINNIPTSGFSLGKHKIRGSGNNRTEWVEVSDPRGFDIEIPIINLLWILDYEGIVKGTKELTGNFVYSWLNETNRVLLPCSSDSYTESLNESNKLIKTSISKNTLTPGTEYLLEGYAEETAVFIGNLKFMKNYGKNYETLPLFIKNKTDILYIIQPSQIKYEICKDKINQTEIKELTDKFEKTAYSKYFWDNINNGLISKFFPLKYKNYTSRGSEYNFPWNVWISPTKDAEIELGIIENNGETLTLGKPFFNISNPSGPYYNAVDLIGNTEIIKIKNLTSPIEIKDSLGPVIDRNMRYLSKTKQLYPEKTYTTLPNVKKFSCIPGYRTVDGYESDSLYLLARCDSFDKPSRLGKFKI